MTRATGVGGVFLRAADPDAVLEKLCAADVDPKREDHDYGPLRLV